MEDEMNEKELKVRMQSLGIATETLELRQCRGI